MKGFRSKLNPVGGGVSRFMSRSSIQIGKTPCVPPVQRSLVDIHYIENCLISLYSTNFRIKITLNASKPPDETKGFRSKLNPVGGGVSRFMSRPSIQIGKTPCVPPVQRPLVDIHYIENCLISLYSTNFRIKITLNASKPPDETKGFRSKLNPVDGGVSRFMSRPSIQIGKTPCVARSAIQHVQPLLSSCRRDGLIRWSTSVM
ncbi:hypothetical protein JTE90_026715 [Oedothorax gibbosus]|uniref:Uncharacterized protein n=1 Tax=Oedothorax gibbosus TaxID=931172 RepID=A0AAV6V208_9ARAC|nr:hypothetical protein JTE90_026715 [Oedothorax gibbosus]